VSEYRVKRSEFTENLPEIIELLADAVAGANLASRRRILDSATPGQRLLCGYYFYWDNLRGDDKKIRQYIDKHPDDFFLPGRSVRKRARQRKAAESGDEAHRAVGRVI
jgi:hypothetical protein